MPLNDWNISSTSAACIATKMIITVLVHDRVVWCVFVLFCFVLPVRWTVVVSGDVEVVSGEVDSGGER